MIDKQRLMELMAQMEYAGGGQTPHPGYKRSGRMVPLKSQGQTPYPGYGETRQSKGKEIMKKGNRTSRENHPEDFPHGRPRDIKHQMAMMNINLDDRIEENTENRIERSKKNSDNIDIRKREERLRGLFGGKR